MKKKIFLTLAISMVLACLFAIGISAAGSTSDEFAETPETIEGIAAPTKIGTSERVVMLGNDGLYYTFPAYYILNDNTSCSLKTNNSVNSVLGYADGTSHKNYVVRIEIPEGTTYINGNLLDSNTKLVYAKMPNTVTNTGVKVFQSCSNLETLILSNSLTVIQNDFCKGCSKLSSPIVIPATVTAIKGYCFDGCNKLTSITNYAENITSIDGNAFSGCPITEFNFPDKLTSIGQYAFSGAQLTEVDLPNSITSLGSGVFQGCTQLSYVRLPEKVTQVPHDFLKGTTSASITLVVPKGCTSIYSQYSLQNSGVKSIIFTGDSDDAFVASVQEKASGWVSKISYGNHCEYYYDNIHNLVSEEGNTCSGICSRCEIVSLLANPVHTINYVYNGGEAVSFVSEINVSHVCKWCKTQQKTETIAKIFVSDGYSTENNGTGIVFKTTINREALERYAYLTGKDAKFGGLAGIAQKDENSAYVNGTPISVGEDGKLALASQTVIADITETAYSIIKIKVAAISESTSIYCGAYLAIGDDVTYINGAVESKEAIKYDVTITPAE